MKRPTRRTALLACGVLLVNPVAAQSPRPARPAKPPALPLPTQPVILTITGNITQRNQGDAAVFDAAMIDRLPTHEFRTWTPWFKEPVTFRGPRLQTVLDAVGAKGRMLRLVALNDYAVDVPISDARAFEPLMARRIDGKELAVRDKGPLFLIYPFDMKPETRADLYYGRSIWQITRMSVQ